MRGAKRGGQRHERAEVAEHLHALRVQRAPTVVVPQLGGRADAKPPQADLLVGRELAVAERADRTAEHRGGLGGTLKTGRVLDYYKKGDENRKLCALYLSLMNRMGMDMKKFGDASSELATL